ncbi:MAG: hypothetical protein PVH24_05855 [Candidatus Zixiibacteriota bacterium]|jgi:hypothetical protein
MGVDEMTEWLEESSDTLKRIPPGFGVFVDMRQLELISPDVQAAFEKGQRLYRSEGMSRSVVIVKNTTLAIQFKRIALKSDIYDWERYIDCTTVTNWEKVGLDWVSKGIDPDAEWREEIHRRANSTRT